MMRLRISGFLMLLLLVGGWMHAQVDGGATPQANPPMIKFEKEAHDFGTAVQGTPTETVFKFKNVSNQAVRLTMVKAACGCTTPEWPKGDIQAGESGEIKVTYNSQRIGAFDKSIAVQYNEKPEMINLYIRGKIDPKPGSETVAEPKPLPQPLVKPGAVTGLATNYSIIRGGLAFDKITDNLKAFTSEETVTGTIKFRNTTSLPIKILTEKTEKDPGVTVTFSHTTLAPGQEASMQVTVNGKAVKESGQVDGYLVRNISFYTDELELSKKELNVTGNFKRVFTEAELASSPTIVFDATSVEGGRIIEGENYVHDFTFKNTGKAPLKIISAKASCGCTAIAPIVETIPPGETGAITVTFNSKGRPGMQSKTITVTSNDIQTPTIGLRFTVEVVKDPFHAGGVVEQQ